MMDCRTARLLLAFSRPKAAELEARAAEALDNHLAECCECGPLARAERQAEHHLGLAMRDVLVPADLRPRLRTRLQTERRTWYWRLPRRYPRVAAAVAAVLLLAVGLAIYAASRPLRPVDVVDISHKWNEQIPASREDIQKSFEERGFKIVVPPDFNYQYLLCYELQEFDGKLVPHLLFLRGQNLAEVYILSGSQFDVKAAVDQPREGSGRFTVELRPGPAGANVAYLIRYTGGSLEGFLQDQQRSPT